MRQTSPMAKKSGFICRSCGANAPQWSGQCATCREWNSLVDHEAARSVAPGVQAVPLSAVRQGGVDPQPSGVPQLDRVLGGGWVDGSVTLVGGEPGIGKSTLLLQAAAQAALGGRRALYVSAEESIEQVRDRAERLGAIHEGVFITDVIEVGGIASEIARLEPHFVVIDSIQAVHDEANDGTPGSVTQVRESTQALIRAARSSGAAIALVGQVTKEGSLAGPRMLEHLVDTVLTFEGDRHHALRFLRAVKHRFGSTRALGVFEMTSQGMEGVDDPSRLFLSDRASGVPGSVVVPIIDGSRPLLVEIQALVNESALPSPRRVSQGFDPKRLALVLAILERRGHLALAKSDVYVSVVGGVKATEPGADLGVALAVASSMLGCPVPDHMVACGELGLGGEIRQVADMDRRLEEAKRLGFESALVPARSPSAPDGLRAIRSRHLLDALDEALTDAMVPSADRSVGALR